ncbi:PREDICTED: LON peptidase N-terminal domain and RING finger protein 1 isoform X1 [Nelumbo nucifera]|uniref:LON peptidase N-terminal domain and RING finger protein 1 isoform X1 n=1 Tax=Nelumbo nucifera TaxID=4432 RepID=A0A1U8A8G5_NELNU|nr:PREDICTED: LON peptidase N-terminal domain and RING finger protein 1 isoform X1 [Nelumbo nucifera]
MAEQSSSFSRNSTEFDDVEEFVWASEGETNMSWDRFGQVFDLMQKGNRAFREGRIEDAISYYYKAHNFKPGDPVILSNRSAAFSRMCELLKKRPASTSEYKPLNGLDPTTHAELALKDAEKVMSYRSNSPKTYFLKANALILLEQYEYARDTLLSGLQVDPLSNPLQACLRNLENMSAGLVSRKRNGKPQRTDDFDCTLCLKLLYEPITTPCGHSFCRSCLFQSMDHGNKCPMCRTVLFINPKTYSLSVTLNNIIQKNFAEEYAERKSEHENLTNLGVDLLPLFVMDVILPCQKLSLNIFEPRYRLMVRRIMEGNHRMGMAAIDSTTGAIADLACEVEITECEPLPDGRFYLEVEGRRRFHILRSWDQDGYRIAEVEWVQDISPQEGTRERGDLQEVASEAAEFARSWIRRAKEAARTGRRSRQIELLQAEAVPIPQDPERFSFWLVSLSSLRPSDKLELLRLRDTKERIQRGLIYLRAEEQGCRMQ